MSQIEELQGRIASALDRISQGLDLQANTQADPEDVAALQQSLEDERTAAQQLEERNKALNERITALEAEIADLKASGSDREEAEDVTFPQVFGKFGSTIERVRDNNKSLRAVNEKLREANASRSSEPHLINSGMMTELDGMKAERDLDKAELTAILETLEAVLGSSESTQGGA